MAEIKVSADVPIEEQEPLVNQEIERFDRWFQSELGNEPLVRSERAILKTFFFYKLRGPNGT